MSLSYASLCLLVFIFVSSFPFCSFSPFLHAFPSLTDLPALTCTQILSNCLHSPSLSHVQYFAWVLIFSPSLLLSHAFSSRTSLPHCLCLFVFYFLLCMLCSLLTDILSCMHSASPKIVVSHLCFLLPTRSLSFLSL